MKLLTFLGTSRYKPVEYFFGEQGVKSSYIAVALSEIFNVNEVVVFATPEARDMHEEALKRELEKQDRRLTVIDITLPRRQDDIWAIFEKIVGNVCKGDKVVVDITHAFRHIPFLSVPAILFLKEFKEVDIEGIYYGAFEARSDGRAPILDLTSFIEAIEFFTGLRDLKYYGGVDGLVKTIKRINKKAYTRKDVGERPKSLSSCANTLERLALLLFLNQIPLFMEDAKNAWDKYPDWEREMVTYLPPVKTALDYLKEFLSLGCPEGEMCLEKQLEVVKYQVEKKMYSNAIELLREIIINYVIKKLGGDEYWLDEDFRMKIENALSYFRAANYKKNPSIKKDVPKEVMEFLAGEKELVKLWSEVVNLRNPVAHAGMKKKESLPRPERMVRKLSDIIERLSRMI